MGSEYAQATMQENGAGTSAPRNDFYGEQDSYLKMSGGARWEVVEIEAVLGVERLRDEKESMLVDERRGSDSMGV